MTIFEMIEDVTTVLTHSKLYSVLYFVERGSVFERVGSGRS
jgi:hypothetical protein